MDERLSIPGWRIPALRFRPIRKRVSRRWQRDGRWSPEEAAEELQRRRGELIAQLPRRSEGRSIAVYAHEEIVDDAITAVVMSPRGVANEHHLLGAFWLAVDHRCRRHREGRHLTRLGSRRRVDFDLAAQRDGGAANPYDALELRDRFARAADLMADLDPREREVLCVMASSGVGPVVAARALGLPLGEVRSAARSANAKLDRIAAIYAAGRMCQFRARAIAAHAAGSAGERDVRLARAHVSACVPCGILYRRLRREMRGREFQRAAVAAFLPLPALPLGNVASAGRLAAWIEPRLILLPRGSAQRTAEVLGGAGIAKAVVTGAAIVAAGGALGGHIVHAIQGPRTHAHHRPRVVQEVRQSAAKPPRAFATRTGSSTAPPSSSSAHPTSTGAPIHHGLPTPPSKSLGYLALGRPAAAGRSSAAHSGGETSARVASVASSSTGSESSSPSSEGAAAPASETAAPAPPESPAAPPAESSAPPTQSGGGSGLGYLGR